MSLKSRAPVAGVAAVALLASLASAPRAGAAAQAPPAVPARRPTALRAPVVPAVPGVRAVPLSTEQRALLDIECRGVRAAQEAWLQAQHLPDGPHRRALEREAAAIKRRTRCEFLSSLALSQRASGRTTEALRTEAVLARFLELGADPGRTAPAIAPPPRKDTGGRP